MPAPVATVATTKVQSAPPPFPNDASEIVIISPGALFRPGFSIAVTVAAPVPSTTIVYVPTIKSAAILSELLCLLNMFLLNVKHQPLHMYQQLILVRFR